MKICKDGRIWGQNNSQAGNHLGVLSIKQYIRKGHNPNSIGRPFPKGSNHSNWRGGISSDPNYDKSRYIGERKEKNQRRNRSRTEEQMKEEFIKSVYGINLNDYNNMLLKQNGVCAICGEKERRKSRYTAICRLTIDHCHITKRVRGLLCHRCNFGLGQFRDRIDLLEKAIIYLKQGD
jgi:hypothetical protein